MTKIIFTAENIEWLHEAVDKIHQAIDDFEKRVATKPLFGINTMDLRKACDEYVKDLPEFVKRVAVDVPYELSVADAELLKGKKIAASLGALSTFIMATAGDFVDKPQTGGFLDLKDLDDFVHYVRGPLGTIRREIENVEYALDLGIEQAQQNAGPRNLLDYVAKRQAKDGGIGTP